MKIIMMIIILNKIIVTPVLCTCVCMYRLSIEGRRGISNSTIDY
jgi:hypothetical protein